METTALRLRRIMEERGLKQRDILEKAAPYCEKYKIKLNKSDLSQFVNGKVVPGQWKLTILGMALGVSETWLMGYDVPMEREKPTPVTEDGIEEPLDKQLMEYVKKLTPDQKDFLLVQLKALTAQK